MKKTLLLAAATIFAGSLAMAETVVYDFTNFKDGETVMAQWPEIGNAWIACNPAKGGEPRTITNENTDITFAYNGGSSAGQFRASKTKGINNLQLGKSMMMTISSTAENYVITQVVVQGNRSADTSSLVDELTSPETSGTLVYDAGAKTTTWTASAPGVECVLDANSGAYIESITLTLEKTELKPANVSWSETECTVNLNGVYEFPTLSRDTDADVKYTSSDASVAAIDPVTGEITVLAEGSTKITAACEANSTYDWGEASYTLVVMPEGYSSVVYDFTNFKSGETAMAEWPEITNSWWTTNPDDEGSYSSGTHFCPLTITCGKTSITFTAVGGHGNVRASVSSKQNNLQLGAGAYMTILPTVEKYKYVKVTVNGNTKIADNRVSTITTPETSGTVNYDAETKIMTWEPVSDDAVCELDVNGGAYIEAVTVDFIEIPSVPTGAVNVETDTDTPAVYYNLQGIRVENPSAGLYIRRVGNRSEKVKIP